MPPPSSSNGWTYGGESLAERSARRRRAFVEAGLELFGQVGHQKTTVRLLCQQAGLTDRYFYESFGSMEDLLAEVYDACIARLRAALLAPLAEAAGAPTEPLLRRALDGFFATVEDARLARIIWLEVLGVSPRIDQQYTRRIRDFAAFGKRVRFEGDKRTVIDGPFAETQELIAGFWLWEVKSMDEAVAWAQRCPEPMPGEQAELELRPVFAADDFGEAFTPELREQEERMRQQLKGK